MIKAGQIDFYNQGLPLFSECLSVAFIVYKTDLVGAFEKERA